MGFFDKAKDLSNKTMEEGKKYAEITKLTMSMNTYAEQLKGYKIKLGEAVLEDKFTAAEGEEELQQTLLEAKEIVNAMNELQAQISGLKNMSVCEKCGAEIPKGGKFCVKCGAPAPAPAIPAPDENSVKEICPTCGAACDPGSAFCICCGTKLN